MLLRKLLLLLLLALAYTARAGEADAAYQRIFPRRECSRQAFDLAWKGYHILRSDSLLDNPRYLTIVDYSRPSFQQRFFVIDMERRQLALSSTAAHGSGSDPDSTMLPQRFSNRMNSRMTSLGFYLAGDTYHNHRPDDSLGLCLFGLDKGYNDSAAAREVVVHYGATEGRGHVYVTDQGAARSSGCPALPLRNNTRAIHLMQGGSCLFIYSPKDAGYPAHSSVLNRRLPKRIRQRGPGPNFCSCDLQRR